MTNRYVWGNENPDGPNYEHGPECKCINCQVQKEECQRWSIGDDCRCQDCIEGAYEEAEHLNDMRSNR